MVFDFTNDSSYNFQCSQLLQMEKTRSGIMEILEIKENDDGSCTMECEFLEVEVQLLLNYAVNKILKEQIKLMGEETT